MRIQLFYFADCPHYERALEELHNALREEGLPLKVELVEVLDAAQAERTRFLGSPTIRINGLDVEESARQATHYGMGCRLYPHEGVALGWPPRHLLRQALSRAREAEASLEDWDHPVGCCA